MKFDVTIFADDLNQAGALAEAVEGFGFDGLWVAEAAHNPFLPLAQAAVATERISLGTAIAVAFARSPMLMAQTAWDLAAASRGRFILGLGTQIQPHITKRFSARWGKPVAQLREYIESLRTIWHSFQTGADLKYEGEYYRFSGLRSHFAPQPMPHHRIPICIAGVNRGLARLAGELCDGFHVHSFHTPQYLREALLPAFNEGRQASGRRDKLILSCAVFVVTGEDDDAVEACKQLTKSQIAFYASTPSYSKVLALHGWADLIPRLNALLRRNRWQELYALISDDMLETFAVVAPPEDLPYKLRERYDGLLDRAGYYLPFEPNGQGQARYLARGGESDATLMPIFELDGKSITYHVRESKRAKRVSLRYSLSNGLELVYPAGMRLPDPETLLRERSDWILAAISKLSETPATPRQREYREGAVFPFRGGKYKLSLEKSQSASIFSARLNDDRLVLALPEDVFAQELRCSPPTRPGLLSPTGKDLSAAAAGRVGGAARL